jgi:hypothetical protein
MGKSRPNSHSAHFLSAVVSLIPDHAAAVSLMWRGSAPPPSRIGIGTAVLIIRDAQFLYSPGDNHVEVLGIPRGEVPGVRAVSRHMGRAEGGVPIMAASRKRAASFRAAALTREWRFRGEAMQKRCQGGPGAARKRCAEGLTSAATGGSPAVFADRRTLGASGLENASVEVHRLGSVTLQSGPTHSMLMPAVRRRRVARAAA